ncbi:hypothetical protein KKF86_07420 [bacterium]|nr:hypothetical protein [bacterium]
MSSKGSVTRGFFWMFLISILLFWLPVIGPLIAGLVGGKKSGGVGNAILAAIFPAIILGILVSSLTGVLSGLPLIGLVAGASVVVLAITHIGPLLVGAIIGGIFSN